MTSDKSCRIGSYLLRIMYLQRSLKTFHWPITIKDFTMLQLQLGSWIDVEISSPCSCLWLLRSSIDAVFLFYALFILKEVING